MKTTKPKSTTILLSLFLGGLVMVFLLLPFSIVNLQKTRLIEFAEMIYNGDVSKIVVVNKEVVEITIKKDKLSRTQYEGLKTNYFESKDGPQYYLEIGSDEQFINYLNEFQKDVANEDRLIPDYESRKNWGGEILGWLLPIIILVGICLLVRTLIPSKISTIKDQNKSNLGKISILFAFLSLLILPIPFGIAGFILAIVGLSKGEGNTAIWGLILNLILPPISFIVGFSFYYH